MSMKFAIATATVLAVLTGQALAGEDDHAPNRHAARHTQRTVTQPSHFGAGFDNSARAAYGRSYDFEGWPTDYLTDRFGDRQAQGRL